MVSNAAVPVSRDTAPTGNRWDHYGQGLGVTYYERYALKLLRGDYRNAGPGSAVVPGTISFTPATPVAWAVQ